MEEPYLHVLLLLNLLLVINSGKSSTNTYRWHQLVETEPIIPFLCRLLDYCMPTTIISGFLYALNSLVNIGCKLSINFIDYIKLWQNQNSLWNSKQLFKWYKNSIYNISGTKCCCIIALLLHRTKIQTHLSTYHILEEIHHTLHHSFVTTIRNSVTSAITKTLQL